MYALLSKAVLALIACALVPQGLPSLQGTSQAKAPGAGQQQNRCPAARCIRREGNRSPDLCSIPTKERTFSVSKVDGAAKLVASAAEQGVNLRLLDDSSVTISLDETTSIADVDHLLAVLNSGKAAAFSAESLAESVSCTSALRGCQHHL